MWDRERERERTYKYSIPNWEQTHIHSRRICYAWLKRTFCMRVCKFIHCIYTKRLDVCMIHGIMEWYSQFSPETLYCICTVVSFVCLKALFRTKKISISEDHVIFIRGLKNPRAHIHFTRRILKYTN